MPRAPGLEEYLRNRKSPLDPVTGKELSPAGGVGYTEVLDPATIPGYLDPEQYSGTDKLAVQNYNDQLYTKYQAEHTPNWSSSAPIPNPTLPPSIKPTAQATEVSSAQEVSPAADVTTATQAGTDTSGQTTATETGTDTTSPTTATQTTDTSGTSTSTTMPTDLFTLPEDPTQNQPTPEELGAQQGEYYSGFLPSYKGMRVIEDQLAGNLSDSLKSQLWQAAAERGLSMGSPEGANVNAALLRAMGLTTEQLQQQGLTNLNAAYALAPKLNPLGQSQQKLDAYVAQLNQYGATARTKMQNDTQMALQQLVGSQNMDLEKQRELGSQALAKINNDATMSRQEKALAQELVIEKLREANALKLQEMQGQTARDVASIGALGRTGPYYGGAGRTTGGGGAGSDAGTRDLINSILSRAGMGGSTGEATGGYSGGYTLPSTGTRPSTTTGTGTITTVSQSDMASSGLSAAAISAINRSGASASSIASLVNGLKTGGYSVDDVDFVNSMLEAGYTPDEVSIEMQSFEAPGPTVPTQGATDYGWTTNPTTGDITFDPGWILDYGGTETGQNSVADQIFYDGAGGYTDAYGYAVDAQGSYLDEGSPYETSTGTQEGASGGYSEYIFSDGTGGYTDAYGYPVNEYGEYLEY